MRMNKEKQDVTPQKELSGHGSESIGQMLESSSKNIKRRGPNPFPSFLCSGSSEHKPLSTPMETSGESQSMLIKKWQKAHRHKGGKKTTTEQTLFFTKKPQTTDMQMGKLLVMNLTSRNKSNLVFDEDKLTTTSIPVCINWKGHYFFNTFNHFYK